MSGCEPETWTVKQIVNALNNKEDKGDTIVVPRFQRGKCWDSDKQKELIDSLEMGFPVGSMLFYKYVKNSKTIYILVDGLQRSTTIRNYMRKPTEFISVENIDTEVLDRMAKILCLENDPKIRELVSKHIIEYIKGSVSFAGIKGEQVAYAILNNETIKGNYDNVLAVSHNLCECIDPYFDQLREKYHKISETKIPVVKYEGDVKNLPDIFERINRKGKPLNEYEVFAASWPDAPKLFIKDEAIVKRVTDKYDSLADDDFTVDEYSSEEMRKKKELTAFEFVFGLSKELDENYPILSFNTNNTDGGINTLGFELLNACINDDKKEIGILYEKLIKIEDVNILERCIKEAIEFVSKTIERITAFKGNKSKVTRSFFKPHGKYQILSLIAVTFRTMYDINDLTKYRSTWGKDSKILRCCLLQHYVFDIIEKEWNDGARGKMYTVIRQGRYLQTIQFNRWESALNNYFVGTYNNKEQQNVANPKTEDIVFLNCIYAKKFTALEQLSDSTFDIEHLAPKSRMKRLIRETKSEGLPISSIGNICYLRTSVNRSKKEKTIYQDEGCKKDLPDIESRFSFTKESDLKWIENDYSVLDCADFEQNYRRFIKERFKQLKKLFYNTLEIEYNEDEVDLEIAEDKKTSIDRFQDTPSKTDKRNEIDPVARSGVAFGKRFDEILPPLPSTDMASPAFVKTAITNLIEAGYTFTEEEIAEATSVSNGKNKSITRSKYYPLFWILKHGQTRADFDDKIKKRYFATEFSDGKHNFLLNSQWYADDSGRTPTISIFSQWYKNLGKKDISHLDSSKELVYSAAIEEQHDKLIEEAINSVESNQGVQGDIDLRLENKSNQRTLNRAEEALINPLIPVLPDKSLKIGEYVRTAMRNLSQCGYAFSPEAISEMCRPEWSLEHFHTRKPFMKRYVRGITDNKGEDGRVRFWSEPFRFGTEVVYITKEWYDRQFNYFDTWYKTL